MRAGAWDTVAMRAVVQRVTRASVTVDGDVVGAIGHGLLVLLGVAAGDTAAEADRLAGKVARLRIFESGDGTFDRSVSTRAARFSSSASSRCSPMSTKGNRPGFSGAARPEEAEPLVERFCVRSRRSRCSRSQRVSSAPG